MNKEIEYLYEDDIVKLKMGWSESMMHLKVADKVMAVQVLENGAQLLDDEGKHFSFPVPFSEAGIYTDGDGRKYVNKEAIVEVVRRRRTQEEILERFRSLTEKSKSSGIAAMFSEVYCLEVLSGAMTLDTLRKAMPDKTFEENEQYPIVPDYKVYGKEYLEFAIGKALDHRGLSAGRSVEKLREVAWVLGRDDVVKAMDEAGYAYYGVPKLQAFARVMDFPFLVSKDYYDQTQLINMAAGNPCKKDCDEGCLD